MILKPTIWQAEIYNRLWCTADSKGHPTSDAEGEVAGRHVDSGAAV
jgi:hypothetical protein